MIAPCEDNECCMNTLSQEFVADRACLNTNELHDSQFFQISGYMLHVCQCKILKNLQTVCEADGVLGVNTPQQLNRMSSFGLSASSRTCGFLGRNFFWVDICHTCFYKTTNPDSCIIVISDPVILFVFVL